MSERWTSNFQSSKWRLIAGRSLLLASIFKKCKSWCRLARWGQVDMCSTDNTRLLTKSFFLFKRTTKRLRTALNAFVLRTGRQLIALFGSAITSSAQKFMPRDHCLGWLLALANWRLALRMCLPNVGNQLRFFKMQLLNHVSCQHYLCPKLPQDHTFFILSVLLNHVSYLWIDI